MPPALSVFSLPSKRVNDLADTQISQIDLDQYKQRFKTYSLNEMRTVQEVVSEIVTEKKKYLPAIWDRVLFMHRRDKIIGEVVKINRKTATVSVRTLKKQLRVPFSDIKMVVELVDRDRIKDPAARMAKPAMG